MALLIEKIEQGTVIDHISAGFGPKILEVLGFNLAKEKDIMIALVMNAPSKRLGKKDIVKLQDVFLDSRDIDKIAVLSSDATIDIIKKSNIYKKIQVSLPKKIQIKQKCPNPKCIVNYEEIDSVFFIESKKELRCKYCERVFSPKEVF